MRYEAPRVGASCSGLWSIIALLQGTEGSTAQRSKGFTARAPAVVSASDAALCGGGSARRNWDQPIAKLSVARIAGARNVPFVGSGQSELAARPKGNFSWLQ